MTNDPIIPEAPHENYADAVRNLQRYLRQLAENDTRFILVPIDGVYESATRAAVENFQRLSQLPVTGTVDSVTWAAVYRAYLVSRARTDPPLGITPFPRQPEDYTIGVGEVSDLVAILHLMLSALSLTYDELANIPEGKLYTDRTEHAVRQIQGRHALPPTGRVDRVTWNALAEAYNRLVGENQ
ncbi:MAG: peptidoglycan-binding protein [Clostridia bacterium]|nr:peptidoglycan-binding protein [Clostridia bacterium]